MKKVNIHFNIHSLLYNNDPDAIETLKQLGKYETYKSYDKEVQPKIVNKITLSINDDDTIDYIKRKLSLELFEKIKDKKNKTEVAYAKHARHLDQCTKCVVTTLRNAVLLCIYQLCTILCQCVT